jgi:hypothetical protein
MEVTKEVYYKLKDDICEAMNSGNNWLPILRECSKKHNFTIDMGTNTKIILDEINSIFNSPIILDIITEFIVLPFRKDLHIYNNINLRSQSDIYKDSKTNGSIFNRQCIDYTITYTSNDADFSMNYNFRYDKKKQKMIGYITRNDDIDTDVYIHTRQRYRHKLILGPNIIFYALFFGIIPKKAKKRIPTKYMRIISILIGDAIGIIGGYRMFSISNNKMTTIIPYFRHQDDYD